MADPPIRLCLQLDPGDLAALLRQPELRAGARGRARPASLVWHDTAEATLARAGCALSLRKLSGAATWRLEQLQPNTTQMWPPGAEAPIRGEAGTIDTLPAPATADLLDRLRPRAAFEGTSRRLAEDGPRLQASLLRGRLRAVAASLEVCRLELEGTDAVAVAVALSGRLRLSVEPGSLAAAACALAGLSGPGRPLGPPLLSARMDVEAGFALVVAHLSGVIQHHAPHAAEALGTEPVHQMRVALRRLRSALLLFRRAVDCDAVQAVLPGLRQLGQMLAPPRDWDVFTNGTGRRIATQFPDDKPVQKLLEAARRQRLAAYTALRRHLEGESYRSLCIALAGLALQRPWRKQQEESSERAAKRVVLQQEELTLYAAAALDRRYTPVAAPGADLSALDAEALHALRLHAKRLRYAAEFFSPLFPGREAKRFLRRLAAVQERLGQLNDATVAAQLMAHLPGGGTDRATAIGIVRGYLAARSAGGRRKLDRCWTRFLRIEPFWQ